MFAFISMTTLIFVRNHFLTETKTGEKFLNQNKANKDRKPLGDIIIRPYADSARYLKKDPVAMITVIANIVFYIYFYIGTNNSLYFAPYLTDVLRLNEFDVSIIGSIYAAGMLFSMIVINPLAQRTN